MTDIFNDEKKNPSEDFGAMLEASFSKRGESLQKGSKVQAEVISVGKEDVFVVAQGRDGVLPRSEFSEHPPKIGDILELFVVKPNEDLLVLTLRPSSKALADNLEDAFDLESPVEGRVTEVVTGGFRVSLHGKSAFCPLSQMDTRPVVETEKYLNKKFNFIITKFEQKGRNIVVSRRKALDGEALENQGLFLQKVKAGDEVTGKITRMEAFGAFVEISGGVEGLLHISEIGWSHLAHPSEALQIGQTVTLKLIKIEEDASGRLRISLSRKQSQTDPFIAWSQDKKEGQVLKAKIQKKERFGFFMELEPGVVGLLPKSAMKEGLTSENFDKKNEGEELEVLVERISTEDRKILLGLPRGSEDGSWKEFQGASSTKNSFNALGDQLKGLFNSEKK